MMRELRARTRLTIQDFPVPESQGEWQAILHKSVKSQFVKLFGKISKNANSFFFFSRMISTYLVHHGYCATAEAFAHSTGQVFHEELASIKSRQRKFKNTWTRDFRFLAIFFKKGRIFTFRNSQVSPSRSNGGSHRNHLSIISRSFRTESEFTVSVKMSSVRRNDQRDRFGSKSCAVVTRPENQKKLTGFGCLGLSPANISRTRSVFTFTFFGHASETFEPHSNFGHSIH